jgi:hypothetical protein
MRTIKRLKYLLGLENETKDSTNGQPKCTGGTQEIPRQQKQRI